jgi:hypothetical protein
MTSEARSEQPSCCLVDGHVHFHGCFAVRRFLDHAVQNFQEGARALGIASKTTGVLLFTEAAGDDYFNRFLGGEFAESAAPWTFKRTHEGCSLRARGDRNNELILIAGRQLATREGLEVLAIGYAGQLPEERGLLEIIEATLASGALAVIPWGFGKWWFRRGALVAEVLHMAEPGRIFLGDNSGRPRLARRHRLFRLAELKGVPVLPGSDPLPFGSQVGRAGCYGFVLEGELDSDKPANSLKDSLRNLRSQPRTYGRGAGLLSFSRYQVAMQVKKRARR